MRTQPTDLQAASVMDAITHLNERERRAEQIAQRGAESEQLASSKRWRKVHHRNMLAAIYEASARGKPLPQVSVNEMISGAAITAKEHLPSVEASDIVQDARRAAYKFANQAERDAAKEHIFGGELTFVIADKKVASHHDRAVIVTYEHHLIERLKDVINSLNPSRLPNSEVAPQIESCSDLYANGKPSGRMVVVRGFGKLNFDKVRGINDFPCRNFAPLYQEITRQLVDIRDGQQNNSKHRPRVA